MVATAEIKLLDLRPDYVKEKLGNEKQGLPFEFA